MVLKKVVTPSLIYNAIKEVSKWYPGILQSASLPTKEMIATHLRSYLPARSDARYILHDFYFNFRSEIKNIKIRSALLNDWKDQY